MNVFVVNNSAAIDRGLQSVLSDITGVTPIGHSADMHATDHLMAHAAFQPHGYSGEPYVISDWASRILNITRDDWIAHGCYKPKVRAKIKESPAPAVKPKPILQPNQGYAGNYLALVTG